MCKNRIVKDILFLLLLYLFCSVLFCGCKYEYNINQKTVKNNEAESFIKVIETDMSGVTDEETVEENDYFKISKIDLLYDCYFYDKNHNIIRKESGLTKYPDISIVDNHLVRFTVQAGTGLLTQYGYYYDVENDIFSKYYYSIHDQCNGRVVCATNNKIIVSDIFDENKYYYEFMSFNNSLSNVVEPIISVRFIEDGSTIELVYLSGDDYNEVSEHILLP